MGIVACYRSKGHYRVLVWTHDDLNIVSIAGSKKLSFAKAREIVAESRS
jgi:hypothetical protein